MGKWSKLPQELLFLISDRLEIRDLFRFGAVCRSWQSVINERRRLRLSSRRQIPWLCFNEKIGEAPKFSSLPDKRFYTKPPMPEVICIGSGYGWLIVTSKSCEISLLNPITGQQIPLPHFTTFLDTLSATICRFHRITAADRTKEFGVREFIFKAVLTSPPGPGPGRDDCIVLFLTQIGLCRLAYARPHDEAWTVLNEGRHLDVTCHKGQIYTAMPHGKIASWDFNRYSQPKPTIVIESEDMDMECNPVRARLPCLVSSPSGDLLYVLMLQVYKANFEKRELVKIKSSLGDDAIFMTSNASMCISRIDLCHLQRNCIYFEDSDFVADRMCWSWNWDRPRRDGEIFVFDYRRRGCKELGCKEFLSADDLSCQRYHATWFLPSLF